MTRHPQLSLRSCTALVTGATGGIGRAIARALASEGARLILTGRQLDTLADLQSELGAETIACDLGDRADVARLIEQVAGARIDVFVANAAHPATGLLVDLGQEEIDEMLEVNLRAPIALARALAPAMVTRGSGHMVFLSSLSAKAVGPASSIYSATKFGVRGFALALREDLHPQGVGVSAIHPGFISDAGMFAKSGVKLPPGVGTKTPEDVAAAVIRAIARNRAELDVAPLPLRVGASFASVAPGPAALGSRILGSHKIASELAEGHAARAEREAQR